MPNRIDIDPAVLRQLASQHDQVARDTREWAKPPSDWLASFLPTYGKIAYPVYDALERYYDARQRAGEALAAEHDRTAESLRASADAYEQADEDFGARIRQAGGLTDSQPSTTPVSSPAGPNGPATPSTPSPVGPPPVGGPIAAGPDGTQTPLGSIPGGPNGATPSTPDTSGPVAAPTDQAATAGTPNATGATSPNAAGATPAGASSGVTPPTSAGMPPTAAGPVYSSADDRGSAQPPTGATGRADMPPMPVPVATPFSSAVANAKDKESEPSYVVGNQVNDDLVLARTLLGSVLAAVDSPVGMAWSVSVMRGPAGAGVFISSNEGRGWMPAGLFLPREVSSPWIWDELLADADGSGSPWEGVSDPARVLAEFGLAWGAKANARLSALVSSGPIDPGLRSRFSDAAMEGLVGPSYDVDLREFTPDTADRLGLTGSVAGLEQVSAVPDTQVRSRCVELAVDAHAQVGRSGPIPGEAASSRQVRERILAAVQAGKAVPRELWDELRDADDLLAAAMLGQRVDVGRVEIGQLRVDVGVSPLRAMVFERRCNELALLLANESSRQSLRDAVYAHEQITEHPQFVSTPAPVSTAVQPERVARPGTPSVTAPSVAGGPPQGAVVAPSSPPPVAPPERS
ncbi:type VII secretion target [Nocardia sp. NBC_01730]|uniref:type VII secretion target n=1 Tax=Nocardia sp. NBC_01730 TaxID=2975998 RepID=UPI002E15C6DB|nr:type VII secretion target [Nocardia sp. NBC_01730]